MSAVPPLHTLEHGFEPFKFDASPLQKFMRAVWDKARRNVLLVFYEQDGPAFRGLLACVRAAPARLGNIVQVESCEAENRRLTLELQELRVREVLQPALCATRRCKPHHHVGLLCHDRLPSA